MKTTTRRVLTDGLVAGLVGAVAVAVVLGLFSLMEGRSPFYVPWVLGSALLGGDLSEGISAGPIAAFNGIHVLVTLAVALIAALLVSQTEKHHGLWFLFGFLALAALLVAVFMIGAVTVEAGPVLTWPAVIGANLVGFTAIGAVLWLFHRKLPRDVMADEPA